MSVTVLKPRFYSMRNRLRGGTATVQHLLSDLLLLGIAGLVMFAIFASFVTVLNKVATTPVLAEVIPLKIIELVFYTFFVLLLISNTIAHAGNVYAAKNMDLLLRSPISSRRLFFAKLLESLFETSMMFFVFALPVALAFRYVLGVPWTFFVAAFLVSIPFLIIPCSLGFILATGFVRLASMFWRRGAFLLGCIAVAIGWTVYRLIELMREVSAEGDGKQAFIKMIGFFDNPNPVWLPSRWVGDILAFFISGNSEAIGINLRLLCATAIGSVAFAFLVFDYFALSVRSAAVMQRGSGKTSRSDGSSDRIRRALERIYGALPIPLQTRAIILKDITSLVRDRTQSLQMLLYLGISLVYLVLVEFMSNALTIKALALQSWLGFLSGVNILFAGFIVSAVITRLVFPSISLEGKAFWIVNSGPISFEKLIMAKFWCWFPFTVTITCTLMLAGVIAIYPNPLLAFISCLIGVCMSIGCTGLAIGVGSVFARFEWESPNQISNGFSTIVLLLSSLALVLVTSVPAAILTFLAVVVRLRYALGLWWFVVAAVGVLLIIGINVAAARIACVYGARALAKRNL